MQSEVRPVAASHLWRGHGLYDLALGGGREAHLAPHLDRAAEGEGKPGEGVGGLTSGAVAVTDRKADGEGSAGEPTMQPAAVCEGGGGGGGVGQHGEGEWRAGDGSAV